MSVSLPRSAAVDVWEACLNRPDGNLGRDLDVLSAAEHLRARQYRVERARRHFVATRAALRRLLGGYTGETPAAITIETGPWGKPYCPSVELHFNLSHAHEKAVFAFARKPVGVDLEWLGRPVPDADGLARRFFATPEQEALQREPADKRKDRFLCCWTLKEALLKARGSGLTQSLKAFAVDFAHDPPAFTWIGGAPPREPSWSLRWLTLSDDYVGALACQGPVDDVRSRVYQR